MDEGWYRAAIAAGKVLLRGLDVSFRAEGHEHLPAVGPVVLAANHISFPDFLFVERTVLDADSPRLVRFMCRHDVWHTPLVARAMDGMGHIPVDRRSPAAAYLTARRLLGQGEAVGAFPEGGISASYTVRSLMPGAVALARETGAPLVPVSIWGSQRLWPQRQSVGAPMPRPDLTRGRVVDVRLHEPLLVAPDADLTLCVRELGHRLQRGLEELQALPEHRPRPGEWAPWYPAHLGGDAPDRQATAELDRMPPAAVAPTWGPL